MCGRTACALCREDVQKACSYMNEKTGKYELPKWGANPKNKQEYTPSYNVAPTCVTPIIISGKHFHDDSKRMLQPMMWGMIPPWYKGHYKSHGLHSHNCRFEGLLGSYLYGKPLKKGNRCVVVCDGFYEWHTRGKGLKQPYFIHMPQEEEIHVEDPSTWTNDWDEVSGWKGPKLVHMAGLYDIWISPEGEEIYSYTIITTDTDDTLFWLHDRMPAIIEGQEIEDWLDIERVSADDAFHMLYPIKKPPRSLKWHPVSTLMNNSRYKDPNCNKPITLTNPKKPSGPSEYNLLAWLKKIPKEENQKKPCSLCSYTVPVKKKEKMQPNILPLTKKIKMEEENESQDKSQTRNESQTQDESQTEDESQTQRESNTQEENQMEKKSKIQKESPTKTDVDK